MTCRPKDLAQKNRNRIAVHCGRDKSGGSFLPANNVCKVSCGTCPGGCGEIYTVEYIFLERTRTTSEKDAANHPLPKIQPAKSALSLATRVHTNMLRRANRNHLSKRVV